MQAPAGPTTHGAAGPTEKIRGQVVYLFAYDVAYDTARAPVTTLLGQTVTTYWANPDKRGPRDQFFYRPEMVRLPGQTGRGPTGMVELERTVKLFSVGAISIRYTLRFEVSRLEDLSVYQQPVFEGSPLGVHARRLAEEVKRELSHVYILPVLEVRDEDPYTVFCLESASILQGLVAETWLKANSEKVARLVTLETQGYRLSTQEVQDTVGPYVSYYQTDLALMDWDAGLVIEDPGQMDPTLHIIELANVQLAELEAYDRALDTEIQRAYRDLGRSSAGARAKVIRRLGELKIDVARLSDELSNTTKFFGDWHLARVYRAISNRFYLADWHRTIDEKLRTLDEMYQVLKQDQINRWMMGLEIAVVVLFVIEIVKAFW